MRSTACEKKHPRRAAGRPPFLTALAPSERYATARGRRHKSLLDWARQLLRTVRRWWPERELVAVADSSYAAIELLGHPWSKQVLRDVSFRSLIAIGGRFGYTTWAAI